MNEQRRMQYLDAMGIDMFVPRLVLPAAKESIQCELPPAKQKAAAPAKGVAGVLADVSAGLAAPNASQAATRGKSGAASTASKASLALVGEPQKPDKRKAQTEAVSSILAELAAKPTPKAVARFNLQLWRVHADLLVVDSRQPGQALPTEQLLTNILKAYSQLGQALPRADKLQWPMVEDATKDRSWPAAQEMVQSFLEGHLLSQPVKHILLFGRDAVRAVLGDIEELKQEASQAECYQKPADAFACEAYCLPSLGEILLKPQLKRSVWTQLLLAFPREPS